MSFELAKCYRCGEYVEWGLRKKQKFEKKHQVELKCRACGKKFNLKLEELKED